MKTKNVLLPGAAILALAVVPSDAASVYTSGHADIGVGYEEGELHLHFHAHEGAVIDGVSLDEDEEFHGDDIVIRVPQTSTLTLNALTAPLLGASPGDSAWIIPVSLTAGVPYLGWGTEELEAGDWVGNIIFTLESIVSSPPGGDFALWAFDGGGNLLSAMSTADGSYNSGMEMAAGPGNHAHYTFGFTKPGIWEIEFTASGLHATDGFQTSTETFIFQVVPEPSSALLTVFGAAVALRRRRL